MANELQQSVTTINETRPIFRSVSSPTLSTGTTFSDKQYTFIYPIAAHCLQDRDTTKTEIKPENKEKYTPFQSTIPVGVPHWDDNRFYHNYGNPASFRPPSYTCNDTRVPTFINYNYNKLDPLYYREPQPIPHKPIKYYTIDELKNYVKHRFRL